MSDIVAILREQRQYDLADEIVRLRARIAELEAAHAVTTGTLEFPDKEQRDAFRVAHDVPPDTPR